MAAIKCLARSLCQHLKLKSRIGRVNYSVRRHLLSDAYLCQEAWKERLKAPELQISCSEFVSKLLEKYEKERIVSVVDINILVNKIPEIDENDLEIFEKLLYNFRHSRDAQNVTASLSYSLVRCYMEINKAERLIPILKDKVHYGIFPNYQSANILMDHFIKAKKYKFAADVAYEMMLQEDFSHRSTALLSLYSCVKHLVRTPQAEPLEEAEPREEDEEEDWIRVKYVNKPFYDDHFDITESDLLLGKTLVALGKVFKENQILSNSLQTIGWGLYEKFDKGLQFLESCLEESDQPSIYEEVLLRFENCLSNAPIQDTKKIEKELGLKTKDDVREELKLTTEEKESYLQRFKVIFENFKSRDNLLEGNGRLEREVDALILKELPNLEISDINIQVQDFAQWSDDRKKLLEEQIQKYRNRQKRKEIEEKLMKLQEKEEVLTFFEAQHQIMMAAEVGRKRMETEERRARISKKAVELDEDGNKIKKVVKGEIKKKKI